MGWDVYCIFGSECETVGETVHGRSRIYADLLFNLLRIAWGRAKLWLACYCLKAFRWLIKTAYVASFEAHLLGLNSCFFQSQSSRPSRPLQLFSLPIFLPSFRPSPAQQTADFFNRLLFNEGNKQQSETDKPVGLEFPTPGSPRMVASISTTRNCVTKKAAGNLKKHPSMEIDAMMSRDEHESC